MKKTERKALEKKIHTAIEKILKVSKAILKKKTEKAVNKSIKKIVKKVDKNKNDTAAKKNNIPL